MKNSRIAIVGGGPAGLMAAEVLSRAGGVQVDLFDAMPSAARKFLLAGRGGLNLTHSEPFEHFAARFGSRSSQVERWLSRFGPDQVRGWASGLGIETFVGSSGRVFPRDMKAAPLLRSWIHRLRSAGVRFHMRHRWLGWSEGDGGRHVLRFGAADGETVFEADAVLLALGGASWPRLGSDGTWVDILQRRGVDIAPLQPANCGFDVERWTPHFIERFAGQPFKSVAIAFEDRQGHRFERKGEFVVTATGIEGSLVYAVSSLLRDEIAAAGEATLWLDLLPDKSTAQVLAAVSHPRGARSLGSHLKGRLGLEGIKSAVLYEVLGSQAVHSPETLAATIKHLPIRLVAPRPIDEAISTAGGVRLEGLDDRLMCRNLPGLYVAGEMLDWEAPTGGYLLTACVASAVMAADGILAEG
ncbi:conserved hypothetical protein [Burkholderiales bacterium 8X]|nr:conserved hypothetical protein [Burkholderiales bacterium 8X]